MNTEKVESIKNILLQDSYKDFCEFIKLSSRSHEITNVPSMLNAFKTKGICRTPSIEEARNFFKELTNVGAGELTRYGNVYKFEWISPFNIVFLKRILLDDKNILVESTAIQNNSLASIDGLEKEFRSKYLLEDVERQEKRDLLEDQVLNMSENLIRHDFLLRPDLKVTLSLPSDFSMNDSERLQSFIRTLPF